MAPEVFASKDTNLIPKGLYCYTPVESPSAQNGWTFKVKCCPYWTINEKAKAEFGEQSCGYCHYLEAGDWEEHGTMLLWDQVKECGINMDDSELAGFSVDSSVLATLREGLSAIESEELQSSLMELVLLHTEIKNFQAPSQLELFALKAKAAEFALRVQAALSDLNSYIK